MSGGEGQGSREVSRGVVSLTLLPPPTARSRRIQPPCNSQLPNLLPCTRSLPAPPSSELPGCRAPPTPSLSFLCVFTQPRVVDASSAWECLAPHCRAGVSRLHTQQGVSGVCSQRSTASRNKASDLYEGLRTPHPERLALSEPRTGAFSYPKEKSGKNAGGPHSQQACLSCLINLVTWISNCKQQAGGARGAGGGR